MSNVTKLMWQMPALELTARRFLVLAVVRPTHLP